MDPYEYIREDNRLTRLHLKLRSLVLQTPTSMSFVEYMNNRVKEECLSQQERIMLSSLTHSDFPSPFSPTTNPKETTMSKINAAILVQLAQADIQDEFTQNLASMPIQLREALEEQRKQESKEAYAKAAKLILQLYKDAEELIADEVQNIRSARIKEQAAKEKIAKIKRAKAYAEATNNYLPLAYLSGYLQISGDIDKTKLMVPADWVSPVDKAEVPTAAKKVAAKK
jgi:hypothetical protein